MVLFCVGFIIFGYNFRFFDGNVELFKYLNLNSNVKIYKFLNIMM